jgi:iron complex outermembrane receptor protein
MTMTTSARRPYATYVLNGLTIAFGLAAGSGADAQVATKPDESQDVSEIVVTGLRASLEKSLDIKRDADIVLDSINSLELGRFPDDDVADSLRHITGVSISRTTGGEGLYVSIRGLAQQYNIVTLNNRILATDDDGRALAFDILPADVISGADVLKSSQASALEGSIGGTVNMRTAHPLDTPGLHSAVRVEGNYNDMSELWGKKGSLFASDTFAGDTLGLLVGGVFSDNKTRTDALNYNTYDANNPGVWPLTGPASQPVVAECCISFGSVFDDKKRYALSGMLEWRPNDQLHIALDGLYARLEDPQVGYDQAYYPDFNYDQNGNPEWSNVTVRNGFITGFTANTFTPEIINQTIDRRVTNTLVGLNATWTPTSRLQVDADVYHSEASRPEGGNDAFVTAGLESATPYNQNTITWTNTNHGLPNIAVTLPNGQDYATALASGALNNNFWTGHYTGLSGYSIKDRITGATLDTTLKFDDSWFRQVRIGVAETLRDKTRDDISNDWTGGSSQYNFYTTPVGANPITFGSLGANVISTTTFPHYMQGAGGSFPHTIAVFNIPALLSAFQSLNGQPNLYTAGAPNYDFSATLPQFNAVNSYKVKENTTAGYIEGSFGGEAWSGNAGVRIIHTHTSASTAVDNIESVTIANTANPTDPATVAYSDPTGTSASGSYTYALPSLNLNYRIAPNLQGRFGASETLTRPELNQLAPTRTDNSLNRVYQITYSGNSNLKPIRAYSVDLSLEWYYQPRSALTLAIFGKKIKDFITQQTLNNVDLGVQGFFNGSPTAVTVPYTIFQPINGDRGDVYGAELGFQHLFANGFGIHGQYTRTQSHAYVQGAYVGQLEGVAPSSGSLGVLYEAHGFSANVSWDYDGKSVAQTFTEIEGLSAMQSSFSWVTAQVSYEILPGLKVYAEGKNLSDAVARTYLAGRADAIWSSGLTGTSSAVGQGYTAYGRTFTVGASYHF